MGDFTQIIQLRNKGKTQEEIASILGISRRSVIRYLKDGQIPQYSRSVKATRKDPLEGHYLEVKRKLEENPRLPLNELYEYIYEKGYRGSERTLRRRTRDLRATLKNKEVFFQREVRPGEVMEGDFTELQLKIEGKLRKIYLWVTSLPFSNRYFATPFYHCSFESFASGSVAAFSEFNGVAKKYRLDNMSPAVSKILSGKNRVVTNRYADFQSHYGFEQDFCNPAKGNEKGNVESINKHLKRKITSRISLSKLSFKDLNSFKEFVWSICREQNSRDHVEEKFLKEKEYLSSLPASQFNCFRTSVVSINKYSLFSLEKTGHMYSVPSKYIGLSLEVRIYPEKVDIVHNGSIISSHKRIYGPKGQVSIEVEHIIEGLLRKPGAMRDWKYKHILFERPAWNGFYKRIINSGGNDKDYLKCLKLINKHGKDLVTLAMELSLEEDREVSTTAPELEDIITNKMDNIHQIEPLKFNLNQYDSFINIGEELQ